MMPQCHPTSGALRELRFVASKIVGEYAMASPGFVVRRGKAGNYVMGHSRRTSGPGAAAALSRSLSSSRSAMRIFVHLVLQYTHTL